MKTSSISEEIPRTIQRVWFLIQLVGDATGLMTQNWFNFFLILRRISLDFRFFFAFGGLPDVFPEFMQNLHGEHELIDLLFWFGRVVAIINTVDIESLRTVNRDCVATVG